MLHFDHHLTERIRLAGQGTLLLWRFLASYGMWAFIVLSVWLILVGIMPWFEALIPVLLTHLLTLGVQFAIGRERPPITHAKIRMWRRTPSFPSAHSSGSMAFALALTAVMLPYGVFGLLGGIAVILIACSIGISRIIVGVHYVMDVLCGFLFGIVITGIFFQYFQ